jgi:hypothetical protein
VEDTVNLTLGLFAQTNRPLAEPEQGVKELMFSLAALNADFSNLESLVSADLSGPPKAALSTQVSGQEQ